MDMKLVHNNSALQNSNAQWAALPDTIYSCLASNGMKDICNVWKYPPPVRKYPNPLYIESRLFGHSPNIIKERQ